MDNYTIIGRLGEGAHGIVVKAKQKQTEKIVALKKICLGDLSDGIPVNVLRSTGCIFAEMINKSPLFPGENDIEQLWLVTQALGTPDVSDWPELVQLPDYNKITFDQCNPKSFNELIPSANRETVDLISRLLVYHPSKRLSISKALLHDFFLTEPLPMPLCQLQLVKLTEKNPNLGHVDLGESSFDQLQSLLKANWELLINGPDI